MASTGEAGLGRRPELDGLRGVAILLVLVGHALAPLGLGSLAAAGVTLFFALSGYLITGLLLQERSRQGRVDLRRFYWSRFTRLAPPLFAMLVVMGALLRPGWDAVFPALTWTTNYAALAGIDVHPFGHAWSLAVEEQFYLMWPLLLPMLAVRRHGVALLAALGLALLAARAFVATEIHLAYAYGATELSATALLAGALVSLVRRRAKCATFSIAAATLLATTIAVAGSTSWLVLPIVATPLVAVMVAGAEAVHALRARWLRWFGVASYSLYLWHEPVAWLVSDGLGVPGVLAGSVAGATAWAVIERPLMTWRRAQAGRAGVQTFKLENVASAR